MRLLAEFIMRGRVQAAIVALIGNWVPLLTPATVALVTLRKGATNGLLVMLWGILPAALALGFSQIDPLLPIVVVSGVLVVYALALLLRVRASWDQCLMGAVALGSLVALLQWWLAPGLLQVIIDNLSRFMEQVAAQAEPPVSYEPAGPVFAAGLVAYVVAFTSITGLILGRWWQSLLYNPGGFGEEFQALRLSASQALVCFGAGIYCLFQNPDYGIWALLFTLPLLFVGLAIAHRLVKLKGLGVQWLVLFYLALMLLPPASQLLIVLAFFDTWLNLRGRVKPKA